LEKYGFVYIWYDRKHKRYYVGSHWGTEDDGYICSSKWMYTARNRRPSDFKRRVISRISSNRKELLDEENRWLSMMKPAEMKSRYYNHVAKAYNHWSADEKARVQVGQKITNANTGRKQNFKDPEDRARKISEGKKGTKFTDEHKAKLREKKLGTKRSEETKAKTSESLKQAYANGTRIPKLKKEVIKRKPGERMKELWANLIWAENQKSKLKANHRSKKYINNYTDQEILD